MATYRGNGPVVPHLDTMAVSSSGGSAGLAFVVGLLGVAVKRGSNRCKDKKFTSLAFVVGLLDIDNKRGGNRGNRATS